MTVREMGVRGAFCLLLVLAGTGLGCRGESDSGRINPSTSGAEVAPPAGDSSPASGELRLAAYLHCQGAVKQQLTTPSEASFPVGAREFADSLGHGRYQVRSYVHAQNRMGVRRQTHYTCDTATHDGGETWKVMDLQIEEW